MWENILAWLDDWQLRRERRQELVRLQSENARLHADLADAHATIGQLQQSYQFYFDAYRTTTQEHAHAR